MANLTITVDEEVLLKARKRALDHGTSVNAVLRQYLESYAGGKEGSRRVDAEVHPPRRGLQGAKS